jgi:Phosphotransferase enzyme family
MSPVRQTNPSAAGAVTVRGGTVVKIQEPGASRRERLRTLAGREVGLRSGLFVVPDIVSFNDEKGEIVFERLKLTGFREALSHSGRSMELVSRVAGALAAIHRHLKVPSESDSTSPDSWAAETSRSPVPLHGDFAIRNVFYLADSDSLAIIDWSNAWWMGLMADVGPPEIDIAVFLMSLFHRRVFGPWPISRRYDVARRFLSGYSSASPDGLDLETLSRIVTALAPRFNQKTSRSKGRLRALGYRHNMPDLQLFLRRLSSQRFAGQTDCRTG